MKVAAIAVLVILGIVVAGGIAVWSSLPKSTCVTNCCDNRTCGTPGAKP